MSDPQVVIDDILSRCREVRTPCGEGGLVWRVWDEGAADGPWIVLLHGGFGAWNHWVRNIPALEAHYRIVAPDLPGCGDSDDPPEPYDAESLAAILSDGLDDAVPGAEPVHLAAFSFSGLLSGFIARAHPQQIASLAIIGTPILGLTRTGPANALVAVPADASPEEAAPLYRGNLQKLMVRNPDAIDDLAMTLHMTNMSKTRLRSRGIARKFVAVESLRDLPCPLDFVFGDGDVTLYPDLAGIREAAETLGTDVGFHVVPGMGHWVQYEAADAFNALFADILRQRIRN